MRDLVIEFLKPGQVLRAVDRVSFSLEAGKTLGIVGESGCGKSVTALSVMRLLPMPPGRISGGEINFNGRNLLSLSPDEMRKVRGKEIAMIFQDPMTSLNPVFTVGFQIEEVIRAHRPDLSAAQSKARVVELLAKVGIAEPDRRYESYPHELSGGMRQRVMIAMALSCEPKLLIADEPTTALDVTIQAQILELIRKLQSEMGMAVLLITHDLGVIAQNVDECVVMYAGRVAEKANVADLFRDPKHPYTRGLLASLPSRNKRELGSRARLKGIPGSVPDLARLMPHSCHFADRCALVQPTCRASEPPLEIKSPSHLASCFEV